MHAVMNGAASARMRVYAHAGAITPPAAPLTRPDTRGSAAAHSAAASARPAAAETNRACPTVLPAPRTSLAPTCAPTLLSAACERKLSRSQHPSKSAVPGPSAARSATEPKRPTTAVSVALSTGPAMV